MTQLGMLDDIILFDFNHQRLYRAKSGNAGLRALALGVTGESIDLVDRRLADAIGAPNSRTDGSLVERAHGLGLAIFVYTVNDAEHMERLIEFGVDAIITNYPEIAFEVLRSR